MCVLFVDLFDKVYVIVEKINEVVVYDGCCVIVFMMFVDSELNDIVKCLNVFVFDMF